MYGADLAERNGEGKGRRDAGGVQNHRDCVSIFASDRDDFLTLSLWTLTNGICLEI